MKTVNIILMNHHPMMLQVLVEHLAAADNVVPEILRRRRNIAFLIPLQVKPALWNIIGYWEDFRILRRSGKRIRHN